MARPINADTAAKLVVQNSQPVISSVPKTAGWAYGRGADRRATAVHSHAK